MRILVGAIVAATVCVSLFAQPAALRIEYGQPRELGNVKSIFISTADPELAAEGQRQLSEMLPALTFAESEKGGDVTLNLTRKPTVAAPGSEAGVLTTAVVARMPSSETIRLFLDTSSQEKELSDAVREVLGPVVLLLQQANPRRYGQPSRDALAKSKWKVKVHTTAGLRPGMSRREVLAVLGAPSQVLKGVPTEIWMYKTTDGVMRLVFSGDRLASVVAPEKK